MGKMMYISFLLLAGALLCFCMTTAAEERQLTFSPKNHDLDCNDNFSPDGRFLCYDTRDTVGEGIGNGQTIEIVEVATGEETVLYEPVESVTGDAPAPGVGACSFSGVTNEIAFIHGPPVDEVAVRGTYGKPNRCGGCVVACKEVEKDKQGRYPMQWLDKRDIATDRDTLPGAHRGGTHRHEFTLDGKRIGFTYDDFLLPQYDRTIGYMEANPKAPVPASHCFALLVKVAPKGKSKPGEIEKAHADSWIGRHGYMRGFIGTVRNDDGKTYEDSLFVVDIPKDVDITTADSGSATRFPSPPKGVQVRRLTHEWANGIVRGSADGSRIAYLAKAKDGSTQVFLIASDGSDKSTDPNKRPVQLTALPKGVDGDIRWHPSGNSVLCLSNNAIVSTCAQPGASFGKSVYLTEEDEERPRIAMVISPDGKLLAYNRPVHVEDVYGVAVTNYKGDDYRQIFLLDFPDQDGDGIADESK